MKRIVGAIALVAGSSLLTATPVAAGIGPTLLDGRPQCGAVAPPTGATPIADDGVLKVSSFNLLHSETDEGDQTLGARLPLIADAIVGSGADIVGAQEVTRNTDFHAANEYPQHHGLVARRLAELIAIRTGQPWHWCFSTSNPHVPLTPDIFKGGGNPLDSLATTFGNFPDAGGFSEGLAVLTRFPIDQSRFHRLSPRSYEAAACLNFDPFCRLDAIFDARQVLWARVRTPAGRVDMFTTHIAHHIGGLSDTTKLLQTLQVLRITEQWAKPDALPDFLVGDFNSSPKSDAYKAVVKDAHFVDTYRAAGGAECAAAGAPGCSGGPPFTNESFSSTSTRPMKQRIDYVFARKSAHCAIAVPHSERIGDDPALQADGRYLWPSDHYAFTSTVRCF